MIDAKVREQILAVRDTGLTNMFDLEGVRAIALTMNFFELLLFIEEHKGEYCKFILYGEESDND